MSATAFTATTTTVKNVDETDRSVINKTNSNGVGEFSNPLNQNNNSKSVNDVGEVISNEGIEMQNSNNLSNSNNSAANNVKNAQKSDWVKFDDDDADDDDNNNDSAVANKATILNNVASATSTVAAVSTPTTTTTTAATTKTMTTATVESSNLSAAVAAANSTIPPSPVQSNKSITSGSADITPAPVLATESVHINLNTAVVSPQKPNAPNVAATSLTQPISAPKNDVPKNTSTSVPISTAAPMRTIELSTGRIREGFANGDVIVTLLPTNTKWPWITPAVFRPELVPEELMAQGLTLTVEEYVNAMETLVNDYRFTIYNICYKRVLVCWILFAFCVLLTLLFSGLQGIALFSLGVGWLFLNAAAIFFCMWIKLRLSRGLEKCLARVNKQLVRHKILLILDDRGRISCHKVNLCFIYFDPSQCVAYLNEFIERSEQNGNNIQAGWEAKMDLEVNDIVIQGANPMRLSRKQERAALLYLRYASRWGNEIVRGLGDVSITEPARHCANYVCACQYIERHLSCKPRGSIDHTDKTTGVFIYEYVD